VDRAIRREIGKVEGRSIKTAYRTAYGVLENRAQPGTYLSYIAHLNNNIIVIIIKED
jgi:capsule polysaccharide export protein KpsE/RkpR